MSFELSYRCNEPFDPAEFDAARELREFMQFFEAKVVQPETPDFIPDTMPDGWE